MKTLTIERGRVTNSAREIAEALLEILGTQERVAAVLGVNQSNVSRWINGEDRDTIGPVRLLAARLWTEYGVTRAWISSYLTATPAFAARPELVREVVELTADGERRLLDRSIETFPADFTISELAVAAANEIAAEFLGWSWWASGDFFGFYRAAVEDGGLAIARFTINSSRRPRAAFAGDVLGGI